MNPTGILHRSIRYDATARPARAGPRAYEARALAICIGIVFGVRHRTG